MELGNLELRNFPNLTAETQKAAAAFKLLTLVVCHQPQGPPGQELEDVHMCAGTAGSCRRVAVISRTTEEGVKKAAGRMPGLSISLLLDEDLCVCHPTPGT